VKARLLFVPLACLMAAFVLYLAIAGIGKADDPPITVPVDRTVDGLTVDEWKAQADRWHQAARKYQRAVRIAIHHPVHGASWLERAFLCIHNFEGSWTDRGGPYYGGLQMDYSFQRSYAPWALRAFGTADNWPVSVQIATAIRAKVAGRGFYPWPNTARYCGLI
jgi:hypothetical protein